MERKTKYRYRTNLRVSNETHDSGLVKLRRRSMPSIKTWVQGFPIAGLMAPRRMTMKMQYYNLSDEKIT